MKNLLRNFFIDIELLRTSMKNKVTTLKTRGDGYLLYQANCVGMLKPEQSMVFDKAHTILNYCILIEIPNEFFDLTG